MQRLTDPLVVHQDGVAHELGRQRHVGARVVDGTVHGAAHLRRGTGEIGVHIGPLDPHRDRERLRLRDALDLHLHLFVVLAVGERGDPRPHPGLGATHDLVRVAAERVEAELRRETFERAAAGPARRHLGAQIADHLLREPHIAPQNREELLVRRAVVVELERRNDEPLLVDLLAQPRALAPADVDVVDAVDGEADEALAAERGRGDEHVGGLAVADPGVVADENVAEAERSSGGLRATTPAASGNASQAEPWDRLTPP